MNYFKKISFFIFLLIIFLLGFLSKDYFSEKNNLISRVAPGETLPVKFNLLNLVDHDEYEKINLVYLIKDFEGKVLVRETDIIYLELDGSYVYNLSISGDIPLSKYTLDIIAGFEDQEYPALSQLEFEVEKKYFGYFLDDWIRAIPFFIIPFLFLPFLRKRKKATS